jgi:AcrR family transcriptional regulator
MNTASGPRAYRQVARAQALEQTRDALLDAAETTFFAGRWQEAPLEEIAATAGVTKQTLLRHFGSKDGLREQAMARALERVHDQRWAAPTRDVAGAVANLLDHYAAVGERAMLISRLPARGDGTPDEVGATSRQLHYDWVDHAFGTWLADLPDPARARRRAALIALCDVQAWWLLSHDLGLSRAEVQATLTDAIHRLLEEQS